MLANLCRLKFELFSSSVAHLTWIFMSSWCYSMYLKSCSSPVNLYYAHHCQKPSYLPSFIRYDVVRWIFADIFGHFCFPTYMQPAHHNSLPQTDVHTYCIVKNIFELLTLSLASCIKQWQIEDMHSSRSVSGDLHQKWGQECRTSLCGDKFTFWNWVVDDQNYHLRNRLHSSFRMYSY